MSTRIVIADDHAIFVAGLRLLLEKQPDMNVVGEASEGRDAIRLVSEKSPHVVIMDVSMPGMNGIEATRRITAEDPVAKVLCLSIHADRRFVSAVLEAGAAGYILKDCSPGELVRGIRTVMAGQTCLSPAVASLVVAEYTSRLAQDESRVFSRLTRREREVLQLLAEGHSTKAIAARLGVSAKTIGTHREHIMKKLDVHSVAGLTKFAIREGLTSTESTRPH